MDRLNSYENIWGKNPKLESFWRDLSSGNPRVILIHKDKSYNYITLPKRRTPKYNTMIDEINNDPNIVAVLISSTSSDAYELYLYPKAKDKTVDYVINHYRKYFKKLMTDSKLYYI